MSDSRARDELCADIAAAEAELHAAAMRLVPSLPIPTDLTIRQLQVLAHLRWTPDTTAQQLAEALGVSTPTMSGIVDRVSTKGWVERRSDPEDRRRLLLRLTPSAERVLAELETPARRARAMLLEGLDDHELADLARVYGRLREVARTLAPQPRD